MWKERVMKDPEKHEQNEYLDDDILEGKKDVLRAKDIIPEVAKPQLEDTTFSTLKPSEDISDKEENEKTPSPKKDTDIPTFPGKDYDTAEKDISCQKNITCKKR
jgi:hypothetical protein